MVTENEKLVLTHHPFSTLLERNYFAADLAGVLDVFWP